MSTTTKSETLRSILNKGNPALMGTAAAKMQLGTMLTPLKRTFTGLTAAASFDLTAIDGTGETTGPGNENRVAAAVVSTLRVTAGAAAAGSRDVTDVGGTPAAGLATISDDGKTITFEANVTGFVITYMPRSAQGMETADAVLGGSP